MAVLLWAFIKLSLGKFAYPQSQAKMTEFTGFSSTTDFELRDDGGLAQSKEQIS